MGFLSTTDKAAIQSAIDLLVKGSAKELPVSEDLLERLVPLTTSPTFASIGLNSGDLYAGFRDYPFGALIELTAWCGEDTLTDAQWDQIQAAAVPMLVGDAYETPFDATVIQNLATVAEATGFLTKGGFMESMRDRPVSTMLQWALKLGE